MNGSVSYGEARARYPVARKVMHPDLGPRIVALLADGKPRTLREIADAMGLRPNSVGKAVSRFAVPAGAGMWKSKPTNQEPRP